MLIINPETQGTSNESSSVRETPAFLLYTFFMHSARLPYTEYLRTLGSFIPKDNKSSFCLFMEINKVD